MANQRHPDQTLTAFTIDKDLAKLMEDARNGIGMNRSHFIRMAIAEKLQRMGVAVESEAILPPDRAKDGMKLKKPSTTKGH